MGKENQWLAAARGLRTALRVQWWTQSCSVGRGLNVNRRSLVKQIIVSLMLAGALATPAFAGGFNHSQPSLLGALVSVGNHGDIASAAAKLASPGTLADVKANVLDNTVKADVKVGAAQPAYNHGYGYGAPSPSVAGLNVVVPGVARADVAIGQQAGHASTLLGVTANVLSGGVGHRGGW
jgi:hypothetical protein